MDRLHSHCAFHPEDEEDEGEEGRRCSGLTVPHFLGHRLTCVNSHSSSLGTSLFLPVNRQLLRPSVLALACRHSCFPMLWRRSLWDVYSKYCKSRQRCSLGQGEQLPCYLPKPLARQRQLEDFLGRRWECAATFSDLCRCSDCCHNTLYWINSA